MNLIHGDCLEKLKELENNSVDLLFCDLPYGQTNCKWDCKIDLVKFWEEINRVCKITTPMFFTCTTKFGNTLINSNPKNFRYDLIWIKSKINGFLTARKMPMRKHELIYVFYRKLPYYNISSHKHKFLKDGIEKKPNSENFDSNTINNVYGVDKAAEYTKINNIDKRTFTYDPPLPNSILEIASEIGKHPTQKPVELIEWILKYYSKEGDVVLDPTMGSGSTGVACKNLKRNFIGIELDEKYYNIAVSRVSI